MVPEDTNQNDIWSFVLEDVDGFQGSKDGNVSNNKIEANLGANEKEEGIVPIEGNDPNFLYPPIIF